MSRIVCVLNTLGFNRVTTWYSRLEYARIFMLLRSEMNQTFDFFKANLLIKNQINIFRSFKVIGLCKTKKFQVEKCLFLAFIIVERSGKLSGNFRKQNCDVSIGVL